MRIVSTYDWGIILQQIAVSCDSVYMVGEEYMTFKEGPVTQDLLQRVISYFNLVFSSFYFMGVSLQFKNKDWEALLFDEHK